MLGCLSFPYKLLMFVCYLPSPEDLLAFTLSLLSSSTASLEAHLHYSFSLNHRTYNFTVRTFIDLEFDKTSISLAKCLCSRLS